MELSFRLSALMAGDSPGREISLKGFLNDLIDFTKFHFIAILIIQTSRTCYCWYLVELSMVLNGGDFAPSWVWWRRVALFWLAVACVTPAGSHGLFDPARWTGKTDDLSLRSFLPFLRTQTEENIKEEEKGENQKKKYKMQDEKTRQFWNLRRA